MSFTSMQGRTTGFSASRIGVRTPNVPPLGSASTTQILVNSTKGHTMHFRIQGTIGFDSWYQFIVFPGGQVSFEAHLTEAFRSYN
jgi:hypothetical protein